MPWRRVSLRGKSARCIHFSNVFTRLPNQKEPVQDSRQFFSSDPSPQSLSVSQTQFLGIHALLSQVKEYAGQEVGVWVGQLCSSLPSKQSLRLSQRQCAGIHSPSPQVNAEGEQVISTMTLNCSWRQVFLHLFNVFSPCEDPILLLLKALHKIKRNVPDVVSATAARADTYFEFFT